MTSFCHFFSSRYGWGSVFHPGWSRCARGLVTWSPRGKVSHEKLAACQKRVVRVKWWGTVKDHDGGRGRGKIKGHDDNHYRLTQTCLVSKVVTKRRDFWSSISFVIFIWWVPIRPRYIKGQSIQIYVKNSSYPYVFMSANTQNKNELQ